MKKLIIAAAIAAGAVFANASQVEWSYYQMTEDGVGVDLANYSAYLFTESAWTSVQGLVKDGKLSKTDFAGYADGPVAMPGVSDEGYTEFNTGTKYSTGTSGSYYLVLADDNTGVIDLGSRAMTAFDDPTTQHDSGTWEYYPGDEISSVTYGWASDVPEATSGLLLLLGVAGLALKRKRA